MRNRTELSHHDAMTVIDAIRARLEERDAGAAVAVVDPHGELIALFRTDGCRLQSITIATNKAFTAAREGIESKELGSRSREEGFPLTNFGDDRFVGWGGGVPVIVGSEVVGAVGVSGLPEEEDIELARMGVALITGGEAK
ncbi:MAG: heme-binding protein [Acidimicrobiia bacterium]|nr:heme-binding protein [Acidimicrobiia bacterium]